MPHPVPSPRPGPAQVDRRWLSLRSCRAFLTCCRIVLRLSQSQPPTCASTSVEPATGRARNSAHGAVCAMQTGMHRCDALVRPSACVQSLPPARCRASGAPQLARCACLAYVWVPSQSTASMADQRLSGWHMGCCAAGHRRLRVTSAQRNPAPLPLTLLGSVQHTEQSRALHACHFDTRIRHHAHSRCRDMSAPLVQEKAATGGSVLRAAAKSARHCASHSHR